MVGHLAAKFPATIRPDEPAYRNQVVGREAGEG
jgi:hypothetical protein